MILDTNACRLLDNGSVDTTPQRAVHAANVKAKYKLYYVDSFAASLAIEYKAALVTSDSDFRRLGHGVAVVWLKGRAFRALSTPCRAGAYD